VNLLVIEDRTADYLMITRHLLKHGLDACCRHVRTYENLAACLKELSWDAVLADYALPGMDFSESLGLVRSVQPNVPIILVSGVLGEESAVKVLKSGVVDFVLKDNLTRLVPAIERALREAAELRARLAIEQLLREQQERAQVTLQSIADAVITTDAKGIVDYMNPIAETLTAWPMSEATGQALPIVLSLLDEREQRRLPDPVLEALSAGQSRQVTRDCVLLRRDGSRSTVKISAAPIRGRNGAIIGSVLVIHDVTEAYELRSVTAQLQRDLEASKEAEQRIRDAAQAEAERQAVEAASLAKSVFLANMSHELRSPLNTILGFGRLIANDPALLPAVRDDADGIVKSGEHLYSLINQVLDLSKLEAGHSAYSEADFDLHLLLEDLRSLFAAAAASRGLQLVVTRHASVPRCIRSDPLMLRQVLTNLIDNALESTRKGGVSVAVEAVTPVGDEPLRLAFTVADSSPGIPIDEREQVFGTFVPSGVGHQAQHGTGLGLVVSRGVIHLLGGEMQIESEVGKGTTVRFDISIRIGTPVSVSDVAPFRRVLGLAPRQSRYRILVVDGEAEARECLAHALAPLGFEVEEAADTEAAIGACQRRHPHLIWMALAPPEPEGCETIARLRAASGGQRLVIIGVTAGSETERTAALAAGCDEVVRKPLREALLFAALEKHLAVRFLYEETTPVAQEPDTKALAALSQAQRAALEDALVRLDTEAVKRAIDTVRGDDAATAEALSAWASEFQYDRILSALHGDSAEPRAKDIPAPPRGEPRGSQ
jgi:PAS domain S-box-containing protein